MKHNIQELYRKDENMSDSFKKQSFEEESVILETEVKAAFKATRRHKSAGVDERSTDIFQAKGRIPFPPESRQEYVSKWATYWKCLMHFPVLNKKMSKIIAAIKLLHICPKQAKPYMARGQHI